MIGTGIEFAGIAVLVLGAVLAFVLAAKTYLQERNASAAYLGLRRNLGKAILIGLELLVVTDIIHSVAVAPSFESLALLAILVVIRTFLSWSLELEVEGRWPWQSRNSSEDARVTANTKRF